MAFRMEKKQILLACLKSLGVEVESRSKQQQQPKNGKGFA
jgi:hypothetical protein